MSWELIIFTLDTNLLVISRNWKGKSLVSNRRLADAPSVRAEKMKEEVKTVRDDYVMKKQWPILYITRLFWQPRTHCNEGLFWKSVVFFNMATFPANFLLPRTQARSSGLVIESHWSDFVTLHQRLTFPWSIARYSLFVHSWVFYETPETPLNETELSQRKLQQETMTFELLARRSPYNLICTNHKRRSPELSF